MVLSSSPSSSDSSHGSPVDRTTTARARLLQRLGARRGGDETEGSRTATAAASAPNPSPSTSNAADHIVATTAVGPRGTSRSVHAPGGLLFLGGGIEALSCSSRAFSASSAARCCRHLSRHTGQTPSRPSRGAGGGSVGILRPVPLGVHPPFPRNAGDGGTGILCAVPWGVLIPFPRGAGNCSTGVLQPGPWSVLPPPSLSGCD